MKRIILILSVVLMVSCQQETKFTRLTGKVFGTTYHIIYESKINHQKGIDSIFNAVNKSLSTYKKDSDISKINKNEPNIIVDDMFIEVFKKAKKIYKETDGYFDPTLGQLINAYGFGSGKAKDITSKNIKELMKLVGFDKVKLENRQVYKTIPEIQFDVNALAKGYGIDVVGRYLEQKGITNYLVEIGGEIRVRGLKNKKPWVIGVENPNADGTQSIQRYIELTDKSMATSGNYRKYKLNKKGEKIVHIINAKTGLAHESNLLSVSVIANTDCADVDAYATAFMAMGLEKTKSFIQNRKDLKVILMYLNQNNKIEVFEN